MGSGQFRISRDECIALERLSSSAYLQSQFSNCNTSYIPCSGDRHALDRKVATSVGRLYLIIRRESVFDRIQEIDAAETIVGRNEQCEIWLPDLLVSREHAIIVRSDATFLIRDLGSRNGTQLNGRPIQCDEELTEGAEVEIRPYRLKVYSSAAGAIRETVNTNESTRTGGPGEDDHGQQLSRLTPAQRRVFDLFLEGLIEKEVATQLGITANTVHDHAKAIYKALSVTSRGELISRWAKFLR